jgi:hypothetical protein
MGFIQRDRRTIHVGLVGYHGEWDILSIAECSLQGIACLEHGKWCATETVGCLIDNIKCRRWIVSQREYPKVSCRNLTGHILDQLLRGAVPGHGVRCVGSGAFVGIESVACSHKLTLE